MPLVEVRSLSGEGLALDVEGEATVAQLKTQIAERWSQPHVYLKLIAGDVVLNDSNPVSLYCKDDQTCLHVTALVTHEAVLGVLQSREPERQREMLKILQEVGEKSGEAVVAAVLQVAKDKRADVSVRHAAIDALPCMARLGDQAVLAELTARFQDGRETRHAAVDALGKLADRGEELVLTQVVSCLDARGPCARCAAIVALGRVARRGTEPVAALSTVIGDVDTRVRTAAAKALGLVAEKGDEAAVTLAISAAGDAALEVRIAALKSLPDVLERGDERGVTLALERLEDGSSQVRRAALGALVALADKEQEGVEEALQLRTEDEDANVRQAAAKALAAFQIAKREGGPRSRRRRRRGRGGGNGGAGQQKAGAETDVE